MHPHFVPYFQLQPNPDALEDSKKTKPKQKQYKQKNPEYTWLIVEREKVLQEPCRQPAYTLKHEILLYDFIRFISAKKVF